MADVRSARANPLDEIRRVERTTTMAIKEANAEAAAALRDARARARELVKDAGARGEQAALLRYEEGMRKARDDAQRILAGADDRVAALRRRVAPSMDAAGGAVVDFVLPSMEEG